MDQAQHRISRPHLTCREGRLINTFATPDIDEDAVWLHGLDGCSRHQLVCAWCVWSGDDDIVTPGHHVDNLFWREDAVVLVATCRAVGVTQAVVWGICVAPPPRVQDTSIGCSVAPAHISLGSKCLTSMADSSSVAAVFLRRPSTFMWYALASRAQANPMSPSLQQHSAHKCSVT